MDTEKVEKARNGNVDEIGNLLMENMKSMYRVAFSILKTEEEISDAISNTTVIVFEKRHTLKNAEFFKTWLIRILINECNKIHRQNKKIIYLENYNQTDLVYNDKYDDFGVRQAIKKLDEDLKTMVILYYFENFNIIHAKENQLAEYRANNISYIFQNFKLIENLTVWENIDLIVELNSLERNFQTDEILKLVWLYEKTIQ